MGIFSALKQSVPQPTESEKILMDHFGGAQLLSGLVVTSDTALTVSTVLSCVKIISEDLAKLPLILYKSENKDSRERASDHDLYRLLRRKPNRFQTAFIFKAFMQSQVLLEGNAYAVIVRDRAGNPVELIPQVASKVIPLESDDGDMFYDLGQGKGIAPAEDVIHLRNSISKNGKVGESVIKLMAETIGLSSAAEKHGAAVFGNGARPGGHLKFPGKLEKEAKDKIKRDWEEMHRGVQQSHRVAVLAEGMEFAETKISHEDMQYLETRTFQAYQICGFFRVAPHLAGIMDKATFSNIEHQGTQHANNAILPHAVMWEEELYEKLLFEDEKASGLYAEFLMDNIIRADYKTRMEGYKMAIESSIMTPNEARAKENMNRHPQADFLMKPMNMDVVGQAIEEESE